MSELVDLVNGMIGRPWNPPEFDCWVFLTEIYSRAYGIVLPRLGYVAGDRAADHGFALGEAGSGRWLPVVRPQLGDAVAMGKGGRPHHCGIYLTGDLIAHCSAPHGVAVSTRNNLRLIGWGGFRFYRHRERA